MHQIFGVSVALALSATESRTHVGEPLTPRAVPGTAGGLVKSCHGTGNYDMTASGDVVVYLLAPPTASLESKSLLNSSWRV